MSSPDSQPDADIPSPCVGICCVGADGVCIGCFRTVMELAGWSGASIEEKRAIVERCRLRAKAITNQR